MAPIEAAPTATVEMDAASGASLAKREGSETPPTSVESSAFDWDPDAIVAARQSRSQSLTDAHTMAAFAQRQASSVASTLSAADGGVVLDTDREHQELVAQRRMRRTKSAEFAPSLSLLQQELGYPRAAFKPSATASELRATRNRRASRRSRHSGHDDAKKSRSRPAATSDAPTIAGSEDEAAGTYDEDEEEDEEEENFLDHRQVSVTGYARDTDGIVYYEIVVESSTHGPLSAYKVRRRFSEFRDLHHALSKVMAPHKLKHGGSRDARASSFTASGYFEDTDSSSSYYTTRPPSLSFHEGFRSTISSGSGQPHSTCRLPPMPDSGGVWSFFQGENPRFLENRARAFHAIVTAAQQHLKARASRLLNKFLGPPPDSLANTNYVSLNRFAAPTLRFSIEIQERKEVAKTISLKRRQLDPHAAATQLPASIAE